MSAGLRYVEEALPETAGVASLLDQLALVQFLLDKLPEAEASARRMSDIAGRLFGQDDAAKAMCNLRLGAVLAGMFLHFQHWESFGCQAVGWPWHYI